MKRSEANKIADRRTDYSQRWAVVSSKDGLTYFCHGGCDCCHGGAGDVSEVDLIAHDPGHGVKPQRAEGQLCGGCLCSIVNSDDSDLDYSVTEEDC